MTKAEFLAALRDGLSGLPREDVEERICFYSEMIDDRIEEGIGEAEAIESLGSIASIVEQTIAEIPLAKLVKKKIKKERKMKAWEIVLLALGSPIWLSLLIAAFVVALSLFVTLWSLVISLWACFVTLAACGVAVPIFSVLYMFVDSVFGGMILLGLGMACAGFAIFFFFACKAATKGGASLSKKMLLVIKRMFVGKEKQDA